MVRVSVVDAGGRRTSLTGFCVESSSTVVTVGSEAAGIEFSGLVELSRFDQRTSPATVVRSEPALTLLRVESDLDLAPIEVGSSSRLKVGDFVYLLSFPEGQQSATQSRGRVADRLADGDLSITGFVTLDGSAGAPVVDGTGTLVGMQFQRASAALTQVRPVEAVIGMLKTDQTAS